MVAQFGSPHGSGVKSSKRNCPRDCPTAARMMSAVLRRVPGVRCEVSGADGAPVSDPACFNKFVEVEVTRPKLFSPPDLRLLTSSRRVGDRRSNGSVGTRPLL